MNRDVKSKRLITLLLKSRTRFTICFDFLTTLSMNISPYHQWVITGPTQNDYPGTNLKGGGGFQFTSLALLVVWVRHCEYHTRFATQCGEPKLLTAVSLSRHLPCLVRLSDRRTTLAPARRCCSGPRADLVKADHVGAVPEFAAPVRKLKTSSLPCVSRLRQVFLVKTTCRSKERCRGLLLCIREINI